MAINTLRPRQNGRHFADAIFKCIFLNENVWIPIEISLKFVPKGSINNNPSLFLLDGAKPLSEPMMVSSLTHICVTRHQWVKPAKYTPWCAMGNIYHEFIAVMSHECHGISNYQQLSCFLHILLRLISKKTPKLCIISLMWGETTSHWWWFSQRACNMESISMSWHHHNLEENWLCDNQSSLYINTLLPEVGVSGWNK